MLLYYVSLAALKVFEVHVFSVTPGPPGPAGTPGLPGLDVSVFVCRYIKKETPFAALGGRTHLHLLFSCCQGKDGLPGHPGEAGPKGDAGERVRGPMGNLL